MGERLSTGIEALDRQIGDGVAGGSIVALCTPPESQGEVLLRELATTQGALYLSTTRTDAAVRKWLGVDAGDEGEIDIHYAGTDALFMRGGGGSTAVQQTETNPKPKGSGVATIFEEGGDSSESADDDTKRGVGFDIEAEAILGAIESVSGGCVVIDPVDPLEHDDPGTYKQFLHRLQRHLIATDGVAFLHVVETGTLPESRWLTLQMADEVWRLSVDIHNEQVQFKLAVTKSRGGALPDHQIKLELGQDVNVDTSRDIA